ncbi:MAG: GrlR family regulatory protein [Xanthobacteraceae bacterium]
MGATDRMDNGLFFVRVQAGDGGRAESGGVFVLRNGRILGGDAFHYYVGTFTGADGRWNGEFTTRVHTQSDLAVPMFGGHEVTVTFSGTYEDAAAEVEGTSSAAGAPGYRLSLRRIADA